MSSTPFTPPRVKFSPDRRGSVAIWGSDASSLSYFLINKSISLQGMLTSHTSPDDFQNSMQTMVNLLGVSRTVRKEYNDQLKAWKADKANNKKP
jgi:hypothetical protein